MLATANNNEGQQQRIADDSVITQYGVPGGGGQGLRQSQRQSSWSSLLCCVRPPGEDFEPCSPSTVSSRGFRKITPPPYVGRASCPPKEARDFKKKTLVLDLDETLVHSSFRPVPNADYIIPVEIDNKITDVYVIKRPWVDKFMEAMGELYEVVVFTASLAKYADPLLDLLDPQKLVRIRLFRDSCCPYEGNYVKDLSRLGRKLEDTIIVDNSPHSYIFQPENAIPIGTFIGDPQDHELLDMIPLLADTRMSEDVRDMLLRQFPERSTSTSFW